MEKKGLSGNMGKTKLIVSGSNLDVLKKSGKYPFGVCQTGVGRNAIHCGDCRQWVHKKCSCIKVSDFESQLKMCALSKLSLLKAD